MNNTIFRLSEYESIKVTTEDNVNFDQVDYCCTELEAYLFNKQEQQFCIGQATAADFFLGLIPALSKSLTNNLQLHESIKQNLGFMENKYCHEIPNYSSDFIMIPSRDNSTTYWVGSNYQIWSTYNTAKPMLDVWLYNNHAGEIIFEITPTYKWSFFPDDPSDPDFITYDEFMKNYQPILQRIIPHEVATQWLDQAMKTYRTFFETEEKYLNACKENGW